MTLETVDRRVLGAVRFLDSTTGAPIRTLLRLSSDGLRFQRSRSGVIAIAAARGLEAHVAAFEAPPDEPGLAALSFEVTVEDGGGRFVARRFTLRLPRDPDPAHRDQATSLFRPLDVAMYPRPAASTGAAWCVLRISVVDAAKQDTGLAGVWLRVVRSGNGALAGAGLTDERGEAVVPIAGIPVTTTDGGDGPVLATEVDARLEAFFDPDGGPIADPDALESARNVLPSASTDIKLASGRTLPVRLAIETPTD